MRVASIIKAPAETIHHRVDLGARGAEIGDPAIDARGLVAESAGLAIVAQLVGGNVELTITGGTDDETYSVIVPVTLTDGQIVQAPLEVTAIGADWTMPDGGAPMMSVTQFVARIGRDQVLRLTDMGDGRIDKGLVIGALIDAQAQAEASLAGRYTLPIDPVPALVAGIIADVAHASLFQNEVPDNISEKRRIALRNLDALRKGDLTLGAKAKAQTNRPTDPVRFDKGSRAYPDGLRDYTFR